MTTRKLYSEELVQLSESLEEMGNLVEASLKNLFFSTFNYCTVTTANPFIDLCTLKFP